MISSAITPTVRTPPAISRRFFHSSAIITDLCNFGPTLGSNEDYLCRWKTYTISKSSSATREYNLGLTHKGLPIIEWPKDISELHDGDDLLLEKFFGVNDMWHMINEVKRMVGSMDDGEISISAYDTAWVALVKSLDGNNKPQFPLSLQWIINNQFNDGSWGYDTLFSAYDRIINTMACVIALKSWEISPDICNKGLLFLRENIWRLGEEKDELMPIGFEVTFTSLIDIAKGLGLEVPYDDPALKKIYAKRNLKLKRIPKEVMHETPTTLLHSLEGMANLDWTRLLKLQSMDGSFLFSPSSTAYALMQTGNIKSLEYLQRVVEKFNGGVPNVYPVDLFEHIWVVDRLQRLGISRYFEQEIKECMEYVHRYWTENGICWARNSSVQDVDDTAMGFRLLRLHGYDVSPDVFNNFEKDGEFFCFAGQANQAVTGIYNVNRASQVMFPGEAILERAKKFSYEFLREKQAANQLLDKWIITKDLPGEVEYALDFPFYASLPRIEARWFIEQYGGEKDVWIGKTLYRMPFVNNDLHLDLAKADFNQCQAIHQLEWLGLRKWYTECNLAMHCVSRKSVLRAYFLASACIFEPECAAERVGWAKTKVVAEAVSSYFRSESCTEEARRKFVHNFRNGSIRSAWERSGEGLVGALLQLINSFASWAYSRLEQPRQQQILDHLRQAWEDWMSTWSADKDETGTLLVRTIELCKGRTNVMVQPEYVQLAQLTSSICSNLQHRMHRAKGNKTVEEKAEDEAVDSQMQELVQCVLQNSDGSSNQSRQTFLSVAKSYYYAAHCPPKTLNNHITKVLFERVV
ncbi:uncharacterized protein A4U43_C03F27940 [Asparagus officinalis]|uniref:Uncharacterized protein n=1 Tax=Asparagus officinalis TaxID=4686 RepID=A0A5P1FFE3_ASPOF|nr:ent-copalyl diphosphate synthase 1, chloroplastic [Asparagus officinalis]ONK76443.1 uncharacterized protein A4U43_C03F27940 [Asparagus officinalis]